MEAYRVPGKVGANRSCGYFTRCRLLIAPYYTLPRQEVWETIIVYCHHGIRSDDATVFLRDVGYPTAQCLQGGIDRWSAEIAPSLSRY